MKRWLLLLALASTASAQTYYNKTTIPPTIAPNTILGNNTGATAVPGQLTSIPASAVPVYSGDCGNAIASSVMVCTQAAGNYNVVGTFSAGAINGTGGFNTFLASPPAIGTTTPAAGKFTTIQATGLITPVSTTGIKGTVAVDNASAGSIGEIFSINCPVGLAGAAATAVTVSIASPGVVTWSSHTFTAVGPTNYTCPINFTGTPPTGISVGTTYYIIGSTLSTDSFQISDTAPHALAATNAINTSGSDGGTTAYIGTVGASTTAFAGAGMSISAGDWDCTGLSEYQELTSLTTTRFVAGVHTSVVLTSIGTFADTRTVTGSIGANNYYMTAPVVRQSVNASTTVYLLDSSTFSGGTMNEAGFLRCRRMR